MRRGNIYCGRRWRVEGTIQAGWQPGPIVSDRTNGTSNFLAIVDTRTKELSYVATGGAGGASGNAGGVAVEGELAAVVNFGSSNVTIFARRGNTMATTEMVTTSSKPVSVAFGHDHLVVLGLTSAESFPMSGNMVAQNSDGSVSLLKGDGTAGQIVTFDGGAMYSETSGDIGLINFGIQGLTGPSIPVILPAAPNNNTPLGMIGRGARFACAAARRFAFRGFAVRIGSALRSTATCRTDNLHGEHLYISLDQPGLS
jgi:hypothetical protein